MNLGRFRSDAEFVAWCVVQKLSAVAQELMLEIRASLPSRQVQGRHNVRGVYPSAKMEVGIQFESHTCELPKIFDLEHKSRYREYYDQPPKVRYEYFDKSAGRKVAYDGTPDFFQFSDRSGWVECKTEDELKALGKKTPEMYERLSDGSWRCPPGEAFAARYGLSYTIFSNATTDWILYQNLIYLEDYFDGPEVALPETQVAAILTMVREQPSVTFEHILRSKRGIDADTLNFLIARFFVYTDLSAAPLTEHHKIRLFLNAKQAKAYALTSHTNTVHSQPCLIEPSVGTSFLYDQVAYQIVHLGASIVKLKAVENGTYIDWPIGELEHRLKSEQIRPLDAPGPSEAELLDFLKKTDPRYIDEGIARQELLGDAHIDPTSGLRPTTKLTRNQYRWKRRANLAVLENRPVVMALTPAHAKKGNRTRRIRLRTARIILRVIKRDYETDIAPNALSCWGTVCNECDKIGTVSPSYKTFLKIIRRRDNQEQIRKREGPRAAHDTDPPYWYLNEHTPRHGSRFMELVHCDHTQMDMFTRSRRTGRVLGKGWLTKLTDAYTRKVIAVYVTYRRPSIKSVMMALRVCVRRHKRLPQIIVVDNGAEFHSTDFAQLLAWYRVTVKWRPAGKPRFGSIDERLFRTFTTRVLNCQPGNTQMMKHVRKLSASHDPRRLAEWALEDFVPWIETYFYEVYDTTSHPALGQSPQAAYLLSLAQHGIRKHKWVTSYEVFRRQTMITPERPFVTIQPVTGARINYVDYWSDGFTLPGVVGSSRRAKYDADDAGIAYVKLKEWEPCISRHHAVFNRLTEEEVHYYTEELIKLRQEHEKSRAVTARELARFIQEISDDRRNHPVLLEAEANRNLANHFDPREQSEPEAREAVEVADAEDSRSTSEPMQAGGTLCAPRARVPQATANNAVVGFVGDWEEPKIA